MIDTMKTNEFCTPGPSISESKLRLPRFGWRPIAAAMVALLAVAAAPVAEAKAPDGKYKYVKASGTITIAGETQKLTRKSIEELGIVNKTVSKVKKSKLKIDRNVMDKLLGKLEKQLGAEVETTITGPKTVKLRKVGNKWKGKTKKPVKVDFTIKYQGQTYTGSMNMYFIAKIVGKKLTLTTEISGKMLGEKLEATAVSIFKRK